MTLSIKCQVIRTPQGRIKIKRFNQGGNEHYHIGIWVNGSDQDLDAVDYVEYLLHPSFKNRERSSSNRANKFSVTIWTWGMFEIDVVVHLKTGGKERINYYLSYELPEDTGEEYQEM